MDLNKCSVLEGGLYNVEATLRNVAEACATFNSTRQNDFESIAVVVSTVFDNHRGQSLTLPMLKHFVLKELPGVDSATLSTLDKRIGAYVRENVATETTPGTFSMAKGPGGGVARLSDAKPKEPKAEKSAK